MYIEVDQRPNTKWGAVFLAAVIFGVGVGFGSVANLQFPTEPTPVMSESDWETEALEAWTLVAILPDALVDERRKCETVRSIRQCAWSMEKIEFGIRKIIQERMPEKLQDALLHHQRSPL